MSNDELLKLDNQLCFVLYACSRGLTRAYRPFLDELAITYPQYLVLLVLWEKDKLTVKDLGEKLYLDSGTLTPLLKRMEKAGLLERNRSSSDERKVCIKLTRKGKDLKEKALNVPESMVDLLCRSGVALESFGGLKSGLEALMESIKKFEDNQYICSVK